MKLHQQHPREQKELQNRLGRFREEEEMETDGGDEGIKQGCLTYIQGGKYKKIKADRENT